MTTPAERGGQAPPPAEPGAAPPPAPPEPGAAPPPEPPAAEIVDQLEPARPPSALERAAPQLGTAVELEQPAGPVADLQRLWKLGQWLALTEGGELTRQSQAAATIRWFLATDLDLPLSAALEISIIDGRPYFSARLLRILAIRHGYRIVPTPDSGDELCTAILLDAQGVELGQATYTMADAARAGLADKRNYQRDPASMLWARAARRVLDYYAPNVLFALRLPSDPLTLAKTSNRLADFELEPAEGDEAIPF